jgi:hypothetical protein
VPRRRCDSLKATAVPSRSWEDGRKTFLHGAVLFQHFCELAQFPRSGVVHMTLGHAPSKSDDKTSLS